MELLPSPVLGSLKPSARIKKQYSYIRTMAQKINDVRLVRSAIKQPGRAVYAIIGKAEFKLVKVGQNNSFIDEHGTVWNEEEIDSYEVKWEW